MSPLKRMRGSLSARLLRAVLNLAAPALGSVACSSTLYTSLKCKIVMDGVRKPFWTGVADPLEVVSGLDSADTIMTGDDESLLLVISVGISCKVKM